MNESTFTFRVDKQLKDEFTEAAKAVDRSGAQLLRDFMRDYVKQHQEAVERDARSNKKVKEGQPKPVNLIADLIVKAASNSRNANHIRQPKDYE